MPAFQQAQLQCQGGEVFMVLGAVEVCEAAVPEVQVLQTRNSAGRLVGAAYVLPVHDA
jgi:hypothetical protein